MSRWQMVAKTPTTFGDGQSHSASAPTCRRVTVEPQSYDPKISIIAYGHPLLTNLEPHGPKGVHDLCHSIFRVMLFRQPSPCMVVGKVFKAVVPKPRQHC